MLVVAGVRGRSILPIALTTLVGIALGLAVGFSDTGALPILLVGVSAPLLFVVGMDRPEIVLALFLVAGEYTLHGVLDLDMGFYLGGLVLLLLVAHVLRDGLPRIPVQVALAVAVALIVLLGVSYSQAPLYGAAKGIRVATLGVLAMVASLALLRVSVRRERFLLWLWLIGTGVSLYAVVGSAASGVAGRLMSFGGGPITLGRLSGIAIAAGVFLVVSSSRWRLPALATLPVLLMALLGSGSRGPAVAAVLAGGVVLLGLMARRRVRKAGLVALAGAVAGVTVAVWHFLPETIVARFALLTSYDPGVSAMARPQMVMAAVRLGVLNPIAGVGTGSFAVASGMAPLMYPHNILAELFAENGAVTAAIMSIVLFMGVLAALRWALQGGAPMAWAVVFGVVFCLVNSMLSGDLNDNQILFALLSIASMSAKPNFGPTVANHSDSRDSAGGSR